MGGLAGNGGLAGLGAAANTPYRKISVSSRVRRTMNVGALSGFSGYSWHLTEAMPSAFDAVRVGFMNTTASAITIDSCIVGATDGAADWLIPTGTGVSGAAAAWSSATFGGSLSGSNAANANADAASNPTYYFSDWVPCESIARTDGGVFPLLMARVYLSTAAPLPNVGTGVGYANWNSDAADRLYAFEGFKSGDFVSANQSGFTGIAQAGQSPFWCLQAASRIRAPLIVGFGDSILGGQQATADSNSWFSRACAQLNTDGSPVFYEQHGWGGQQVTQYYARWARYLSAVKAAGSLPSIAVFQGGSTNGFSSAASYVQTAQHYVVRFIADCLSNGILPIITTMQPNNNYGVAIDTWRQKLNANLRDIATNAAIGLIDVDAAVTAGGLPARFISGYAYSDGIHMVDAGHGAAKVVAYSALQSALSLFY